MLNKNYVTFLTKFRHRLALRVHLIDLMTKVDSMSRNRFVMSGTEYKTLHSSGNVTLSLITAPPDLKYDPPWPQDMWPMELRKNPDPIHVWRADNGIEMIHREPSLSELLRINRNWQTMSDEQQEASNKKCNELFGCDNKTLFEGLLDKYINDSDFVEGSIIICINQDDQSESLAYIDSLNRDKDWTANIIWLTDDVKNRLFTEIDEFDLTQDMIEIPIGNGPVLTTVGRYITNYLMAVYPFKDPAKFFEYSHGVWDMKAHHKKLVAGMLLETNNISIDEYKRYANMFFFLGSFTELCVPSYTKKSLTTDPNIQKIKMALYLANKEKIDAGDPVAIAAFEDALIKIDKAYLADDPSSRMLDALGGKAYNVARKKVYLTQGGVEEFAKHAGAYSFIFDSLSDGWNIADMPKISNEIRRGSFNRGHETQLGGAQTKNIVRVFQDYVAKIDDCGTTEGIKVDFNILNIKNFIGRYIKEGTNWIKLTNANMAKYDKTVQTLRTPQYCKAKGCICYKCCGERFANLDIKHVTMILAELTSKFTTMALKAMHGTKLSVFETNGLDQFII